MPDLTMRAQAAYTYLSTAPLQLIMNCSAMIRITLRPLFTSQGIARKHYSPIHLRHVELGPLLNMIQLQS